MKINKIQAKKQVREYCSKLNEVEDGDYLTLSLDCYGTIERHDSEELIDGNFGYFLNEYKCWLFSCNFDSSKYIIVCNKSPRETWPTW